MTESDTGFEQWLPDARAGSADGLGQLLELCRGYLMLVARKELDPALLAKGGVSDLVQETMFDAVQAFPKFTGDSEAELLAWLRRMLLNNLITFTRRYREADKRQVAREIPLGTSDSSLTNPATPPAGTATPSGNLMAREEAAAVKRALVRLPDDYRRVIALRYQEGLSFEEIGQRLQRSANAVRKLWARAIDRLQHELEPSPMTSDDPTPADENFADLLAAWDDALAAGSAAAVPFDTPEEMRYRLGRNVGFLQMLRRWGTAQRIEVEHPADALSWSRVGRFELRCELGRGGFGIVYLAFDPLLDREVALKVPRPEAVVSPELRERFFQEGRAAASLDHPHIVPVYESGQVGPVSYIVSAYCPGPTLAAWLRQQPGPVPLALATALVAVLADAVQHAHSHGIFHRDLKPGNVLLTPRLCVGDATPDGLPFVPRLTDFGLAKLLEAEIDQTSSGVVLGTPPYMAPEQAEGWAHSTGAATDVYALGVILYELLTGRLPFLGGSVPLTLERIRSGDVVPPRQLRPDLPRDLETICLKCLRRDPRQRYESAAALADDLRRHLRREPVRARPLYLLGRFWNGCRTPNGVRDAGALSIFIGSVVVGGAGIGLILLVVGSLPVYNPLQALGYMVGLLAGVGLLLVWNGRRTIARSRAALWTGLVLACWAEGYQMGCPMGLIPSGGLEGDRDLSTLEAQMVTLTVMNLILLGFYTIALIAYYANRHIPGFLPDPITDRRTRYSRPG